MPPSPVNGPGCSTSVPKFRPVALWVLTGLVILAASAGTASAAGSEPALQLSGDLRLRYELDFDSVRGDGRTRREDRSRFRSRTRVRLGWQPTAQLAAIARIRHGDPDSQQGPHVTWWTDSGDEGVQDKFVFDRLFVRWSKSRLTARAGRETLPLWQPHLILWNTDVFIDGGSLSWSREGGASAHAGAWLLPGGDDDHAVDDRSLLLASQFVYEWHFGINSTVTVGEAVLRINDDPDVFNATNDDADYTINSIDVRLKTRWRNWIVVAGADYYQNFERGPATDRNADANDGYAFYALVGDVRRAGALQLGYFLAYIEKYAVARFFAQNDWFRFGSATQTRSSDYFGHELRATYSFGAHADVVLRSYFVETLSDREHGKRWRIDFNWRF